MLWIQIEPGEGGAREPFGQKRIAPLPPLLSLQLLLQVRNQLDTGRHHTPVTNYLFLNKIVAGGWVSAGLDLIIWHPSCLQALNRGANINLQLACAVLLALSV